MSSINRAAGRGRGARSLSTRVSDQALLDVAVHLTARDRRLVRAIADHRVLTTAQLAALGFGSAITARHRLAALADLGVVRRFRPHREVGSAPWHYLLGPVGAALLGAEDRDQRKWLAAIRSDRQLALERSQRLDHMIGVNWFFTALVASARQAGDAELRLWLSEAAAIDWLHDQVRVACNHLELPHPDGLGAWTERGQETAFLLEYDSGSEHLPQLTAKLGGYGSLAKAMADLDHACPLLLFCFPGPRREQAARRALAACHDAPALRIANAAIDPERTSPAGPVWMPLVPGRAGGPVALCALDAALPDPWRDYRSQSAAARERAARAARPPHWAYYPYDIDLSERTSTP
jgi:Replication-relaxation